MIICASPIVKTYKSCPSPRQRKKGAQSPVKDFVTLIRETRPENWQKRTSGVFTLVNSIPTTTTDSSSSPDLWYNSPHVLRQLANPFSEMLRDPRSMVVKRTCEGISKLFAICQLHARYLLKDMMPTVLAIIAHAQSTSLVTRKYIQTMMEEAISMVPCKMVMPLWLDCLKVEKRNHTVRDVCVLYLGLGLQHWSHAGYLSDENLFQVGTALIEALRDPSASVRKHAREGLEQMQYFYPLLWDKLVGKQECPQATSYDLLCNYS